MLGHISTVFRAALSGFGNSPMGLFPFGVGTPLSTEDLSTTLVAARSINPNSGDYVFADDGGFASMSPTSQRVLLTLTTELGSAAGLPNFGNGILKIKVIDQSFDTRVRNAVKLALYQMTDIERVIRVNSVDIQKPGNSSAIITVNYTVIATGTPEQVSITPQ